MQGEQKSHGSLQPTTTPLIRGATLQFGENDYILFLWMYSHSTTTDLIESSCSYLLDVFLSRNSRLG